MTIEVDSQDEIPQALYTADPGFTGVHISRVGNKYRIELTYDLL